MVLILSTLKRGRESQLSSSTGEFCPTISRFCKGKTFSPRSTVRLPMLDVASVGAPTTQGPSAFLNKRRIVVGHSYGGGIAIQLALDSPQYVHSLSLLEPMLPQAIMSELPSLVAEFNKAFFQTAQVYQQGNKAAAIESAVKFSAGADLVSKLDSILPGAMEQAVRDADTFFQVELPAMQSWTFAMKQSRNIKQPILFMVGGESFFAPFADQIREITARWFPEAQREALIPQATHAFPMTKPDEVARNLSEFFRHYPLRTAS